MDDKATILARIQGTLDTMQTQAETLWGLYNAHLAGRCTARERRDLILRSITAVRTLETFAAKLQTAKPMAKAA